MASTSSPAAALLSQASLPQAAHRAAMAIPSLHDALAAAPGLSPELFKRLYQPKVGYKMACAMLANLDETSLASPGLVDHVLTVAKESRDRPLAELLRRFRLSDAQLTQLASLPISEEIADRVLHDAVYPVAIRKLVAPRASSRSVTDFLRTATAQTLPDIELSRLLEQLSHSSHSDTTKMVATLCDAHPALVEVLLSGLSPTMLVGASTLCLDADRQRRLLAWTAALYKDARHQMFVICANLLDNPTTTLESRAVAESLLATHGYHTQALSEAVPHATFWPYVESFSTIDDPELIDRLLMRSTLPNWHDAGRLWQWVKLAYNPTLTLDNAVRLVAHLSSHRPRYDLSYATFEPVATLIQLHGDLEELLAAECRRAATIFAHALDARKDDREASRSAMECKVAKPQAPLRGSPRDGADLVAMSTDSWNRSNFWQGLVDNASAYFTSILDENEAAWAIAFTLMPEFHGKARELASAALGSVAS